MAFWRAGAAGGPAGAELKHALNRAFADTPTLPPQQQSRASFEVFDEQGDLSRLKQHRAAGARTILATTHVAAQPQPAVLSPTARPPGIPLPPGAHHGHAPAAHHHPHAAAQPGAPRSAEEQAAYEQWRAQHPCVLQRLGDVQALLAGKRLAVFLDYDGTLTPIVSNPDDAILSQQMRDVVRSVAQLFPTAIISGRGREKVENFVQLKELYYAGSHGMDIAGPSEVRGGGSSISPADMAFQPAAHFRPLIDAVYKELLERLASIPGSSVEHNTFCVSAHFRNCSAERWHEVVQVVEDIVAHNPELRMTRGRKVVEVRPKVNWHKGTALDHLLGVLGLRNSPDVVSVYIGDDHTDEDAFRVLRDTQQGFGVLVSSKVRDTAATYTARDPSDVQAFLQSLVAWGASEHNGWRSYQQQGATPASQPPTPQSPPLPPQASPPCASAAATGEQPQSQAQLPSAQQQQQQHCLANGDGGGGGGGGEQHAAQEAHLAGQQMLPANNHGLLSLVGSPPQQQATPING